MLAFNANRMKAWLLRCVNKINAYVTFMEDLLGYSSCSVIKRNFFAFFY